jgi:hypothetical protein
MTQFGDSEQFLNPKKLLTVPELLPRIASFQNYLIRR